MEASFKLGSPQMLDHTPGSAVATGEVVVVGELTLVCHRPIAANELGALAAGGGVYDLTAGTSATAGAKVYWDNSTNKVTTSAASGANKQFGYVVPGSSSAADNDPVRVLHRPGP